MSGVAPTLTGQTFGRLTVGARAGTDTRGYATWHCRCECGKTCRASSSDLRTGHRKSCGCLRRDNALRVGPRGIAASAAARRERAQPPAPRGPCALAEALGIRPPPPSVGRVHLLQDD